MVLDCMVTILITFSIYSSVFSSRDSGILNIIDGNIRRLLFFSFSFLFPL